MLHNNKTKIIIIVTVIIFIAIFLFSANVYYKEQKIKEHISKGWLYYKQQKLDKAREEFKMILDIASSAEAYYGTGVTYSETEPDKARQNLLIAEKLEPNHPYIHFYLGNLAFMERNYTEAIRYYEKAIALSPDNPEFYGLLMEVYLFSGDKDKGKTLIREYRKIFPGLNNKQIEEIIKLIENGRPQEPQPPSYPNIGIEYLCQGKYKEARKYFEEALHINPSSYESEYGLGLCYVHSDKKNAKIHFKKAIQFNNCYTEPHISLAELYFSENNYTQAIEYCTKGIAIAPNTAKLHLLLGLSYYRSGNKSKALEPLKKYLELDPDGTNANTVKQIIEQIH